MIHLDTNVLIGICQRQSELGAVLAGEISAGKIFACCSVAWSEFCNGPASPEQTDHVLRTIESRILPFDRRDGELAAMLFNFAGRRRGSNLDCMIAAAAIRAEAPLGTQNTRDFSRFESQGLQLEPLN